MNGVRALSAYAENLVGHKGREFGGNPLVKCEEMLGLNAGGEIGEIHVR
jgi:hypothetical protein